MVDWVSITASRASSPPVSAADTLDAVSVFSDDSLVVVGSAEKANPPTFAAVARRVAPVPSQASASAPHTIRLHPGSIASRIAADQPVVGDITVQVMPPNCDHDLLHALDGRSVLNVEERQGLSVATPAALGSGMRETGRRCGLRVIAGNDFVVHPRKSPTTHRPRKREEPTSSPAMSVRICDADEELLATMSARPRPLPLPATPPRDSRPAASSVPPRIVRVPQRIPPAQPGLRPLHDINCSSNSVGELYRSQVMAWAVRTLGSPATRRLARRAVSATGPSEDVRTRRSPADGQLNRRLSHDFHSKLSRPLRHLHDRIRHDADLTRHGRQSMGNGYVPWHIWKRASDLPWWNGAWQKEAATLYLAMQAEVAELWLSHEGDQAKYYSRCRWDFFPFPEDNWDVVRPAELGEHRYPAPPSNHAVLKPLVETRIVRFMLTVMGPSRASDALSTIAQAKVYRFVAADLLHPDGLRKRHAKALAGVALPTFSASPSSPRRYHNVSVGGRCMVRGEISS